MKSKLLLVFFLLISAGLPAQKKPAEQLKGRYNSRTQTFTPSDTSYHTANFVKGCATVCKDGKFGFIDTTGKIIRPIDQQIDYFPGATVGRLTLREVWIAISTNVGYMTSSYMICDSTGTIVVPAFLVGGNYSPFPGEGPAGWIPITELTESIAFDLTSVLRHGVIDLHGNMIVPFGRYESVGALSCGRASVRDGKKYGYIDSSGKEVIPCRYDDAFGFSNGKARVRLDEVEFYIDTKGNRLAGE